MWRGLCYAFYMYQETFGVETSDSLSQEIDKLKADSTRVSDDELEGYMQERLDFQRRLVKILGGSPHEVGLVADVCQATLEWHMIMGSTPPFQVEPDLVPAEVEVRERIREEIRSFVRYLRQKYL